MTFSRKKITHFFRRAILVLLFIFIGIIGVLYYLLATDNEQIPALICQMAKKEFDIEMAFSNINTDRTAHFPYLTLEVENLYIQGSHYETHEKDFFQAKKLTFLLSPWELIQKQYSIHEVIVDSAMVFFHKDSLSRSNSEFLKELINPTSTPQKQLKETFKLEKITFHHILFDIEDDLKNQDLKVEFLEADLNLDSGFEHIQLDAQCHFSGLYFKKRKGGFLIDKDANLQLDIDINTDQVQFNNSNLTVGQDRLKLDGYITRSDTSHLNLIIESDGILLENARSLLTRPIQKVLGQFEIDQPIRAKFELDGPIISGFPPPLDVDFATDSAQIKFNEVVIHQSKLVGNFSNDCFVTDRITPESGCVTIHEFVGTVSDKFPVKFSGKINDLKRFKNIEVAGETQMPLKYLNEYFANQNQLNITSGNASVTFEFKGNPIALTQGNSREVQRLEWKAQLRDINFTLNNKSLPLKILNGNILLKNSEIDLQNISLKTTGAGGIINGKIQKILPFFSKENQQLKTDLAIDFQKIDLDQFLKSLPEATMANDPKDTLLGNQLAAIINQISDLAEVNLQLDIQDFEYEDIRGNGIKFNLESTKKPEGVELIDSTFGIQITDFQANFFKGILATGDFSISNMDDPKLDMNMILSAPATKLLKAADIEQFSATSGHIELDANAHIYLNDYPKMDKLLERIVLSSKMKTKGLNLVYYPQNLAVEQLNSTLHFNEDTLLIDNLSFQYNDFEPKIRGNIFDLLPLILNSEHSPNIDLDILIPTIKIESWADLKFDSIFSPREMIARIDSIFRFSKGQIDVHIPDLQLPNYPIENLSFLVQIDNPDSTKNKGVNSLKVKGFHADVFGDIPIDGQFQIKNLQDPNLTASITSLIPLHNLKRVLNTDDFIGKGGNLSLKLDYKVAISDELTVNKYLSESVLQGQAEFKKAHISYPSRAYEFTSINSQMNFNQQDLEIDTLSMKVNSNSLYLTGKCPNFLPYFFNQGKMLHIHGELNSPSFDFKKFSTPRTLLEEGKGISRRTERADKLHKMSHFLEEAHISVTTTIEEVKYESFIGNQVTGEIRLGADSLVLDQMSLQTASGEFGVHGVITNFSVNQPTMDIEAYFSGTEINEVFKGFQNFGQSILTDENLKGKLSANIHFKADLNNHYEVKPASIDGNAQLKVSDGELINFPPLDNLTGFLFKKRQLDNIYFDTLLTHLKFDGLDLRIDDFYIHSSAATLNIDGLYTFGKQDKTHVFFEVPLSNFFKRHIHRDLIRQHYSKRAGLPILVEAKEEDKKLKFKLKLFKRKGE